MKKKSSALRTLLFFSMHWRLFELWFCHRMLSWWMCRWLFWRWYQWHSYMYRYVVKIGRVVERTWRVKFKWCQQKPITPLAVKHKTSQKTSYYTCFCANLWLLKTFLKEMKTGAGKNYKIYQLYTIQIQICLYRRVLSRQTSWTVPSKNV